MAIVNNTASAIGDVFVIIPDTPLSGVSAVTGFVDDLVGVTATRFFTKTFRHSFDGFNWSAYSELNPANLAAIPINNTLNLFMEYRYTRAGTDATGLLEFNSVSLQVTVDPLDCGPTYAASPFVEFFDCHDPELAGWCYNVLEKVYKSGIIAKYLERNRSANANDEDRDYLDFWRSITCFFSILVNYARVYETFYQNETLLQEYLISRGIYICENTPYDQMLYIMEHLYDEVRKRGTVQITKTVVIDGVELDGELLRLVCFSQCDEFLFRLISQYNVGWTVDIASPLYTGTQSMYALTKAYEFSKDVESLGAYPLLGSGSKAIVAETFYGESIDAMELTVAGAANISGIGEPSVVDKRIPIDPSIGYRISFYVKQDVLIDNLSFEVYGFNEAGVQIDFTSANDGSTTNTFFVRESLNIVDEWYHIVGVIYPSSTAAFGANSLLNIGFGYGLIADDNMCSIVPRIYNDDTNGEATVLLYNIKVAPLTTGPSLGFIHSNNLILGYLKNNNTQYSQEQISTIIREYLIPYNSTYLINWL